MLFDRKVTYHVTVSKSSRVELPGEAMMPWAETMCIFYELSQIFGHTFLVWAFLFPSFRNVQLGFYHPFFPPITHNVISLCNLI